MFPATTILAPSELKGNKFFDGFSEKEIAELLKACSVLSFKSGNYILREEEDSRHIFVILSGKISIGKVLYAGDEKELSVLGPGDFLGEMAFLTQRPRSASASCTEEATLLKLEKESFDKLAARKPAIAYKLIMKIAYSLADRLRETNDVVESIFSNPNKAILELKTRLFKIQAMLLRR